MKNLKLILFGWLIVSFTTQAQIYVDLSASGNNDGSSWADAFTDIQSAVNAAMDNDEIQIAEGVYQQGTEILISKPLTLKGGYPTGGGTQDIDSYPSIIDGNMSHRVLNDTANLNLEGLTIQNGASLNSGAGIYAQNVAALNLNKVIVKNNITSSVASEIYGGGIFTFNTNMTVSQSEIINNEIKTDNSSDQLFHGAGIYSARGNINTPYTLTITNSKINNNSFSIQIDGLNGGRVYGIGIFTNVVTTLINTEIDKNTIPIDFPWLFNESYGGGIYSSYGMLTLVNSTVTNNFINGNNTYGAGIYGIFNTLNLINSELRNNTASSSSSSNATALGGGLYLYEFNTTVNLTNSSIHNNTVLSNSSTNPISEGGGIYGETTLQNSLLWGNEERIHLGGGNYSTTYNQHQNGTLTTNYSLIMGQNPIGTNNIDATEMGFDPLFVDEAGGDFRLQDGSPLIDAGDFNLLPLDDFDVDGDGDLMESIPLDLGGYARDVGFNVDIGPYEYGDLIFRDGF